ncbi:RND family transporter [Actinomycetes bacterium M1A6_2h]
MLVWILLAVGANVFVPQLETVIDNRAQGFLPDSASSVKALQQMGERFGDGRGSNNYVYLLMESDETLDDADRAFYTDTLDRLTSDTEHVTGALDLWSNPDLAPAAQSGDGKAAYVLVNLAGNMGTALAIESTQAARDIIAAQPTPPGLTVHITGPSAIVNDELLAISDSMLILIGLCSLFVTVVLLLVYRSISAAVIPLLTVAISLATARSVVALFAETGIIDISIFAAALSAVVVLGAGTNYGIFLIGRYQEARRHGIEPEDAYYAALAGVQHIIVASALTVAGAMACLTVTRLAIFSTSGLPCTIAILVCLAAALTMGPALLAVAARLGLAEPRRQSAARWRRIGTSVVRWPAPILAVSLIGLSAASLMLIGYSPSYDERRAQPSDSLANIGFAAADRHLPENTMAPSVAFLEADHDMRNPADLIALSKLSDAIAATSGVRTVQSVTRPMAAPLSQASLASQAGYIGDRFSQLSTVISTRLADLDTVIGATDRLDTTVTGLEGALRSGSAATESLTATAADLTSAAADATEKLGAVRVATEPAKQVLQRIPDCRSIEPCNAAQAGLALIDDAPQLNDLASRLESSTRLAAQALPQASAQLPVIRSVISQIRQLVLPLQGTLAALPPQLGEVTSFLDELRTSYGAGTPGTGFFLPTQAFESPLFQSGLKVFFSPDGQTTRMVIVPEPPGFSREAMDLSATIVPAAVLAMKDTSLAGSTVSIGGPGGTLLNIETFVEEDFLAIVIAAFAFVFCVVLVLLRSLVAAVVVIGTVSLSYLAAMGMSVLLWQYIIGNPLHWSVAPIAFTFLVAVGADYNLLLVSRFKEEMRAGTGTGLIRAMVGTGSVVTTAGITFGLTMFAMLVSDAHNIAQIGTTVAIGLAVDTLVVRSLVVPAIARLAGRWFWWPTAFVKMPPRTHQSSRPAHSRQ